MEEDHLNYEYDMDNEEMSRMYETKIKEIPNHYEPKFLRKVKNWFS